MKLAVSILLFGALAARGAEPAGVWDLAYKTASGHPRESKLELKANGDSLEGTLSSERGTAKIESGKITGDEIAFDLVRNTNNDLITVHFKGRIDGSTIKLTMQYGSREPVVITGKKGS
jgi:hypothetical protein